MPEAWESEVAIISKKGKGEASVRTRPDHDGRGTHSRDVCHVLGLVGGQGVCSSKLYLVTGISGGVPGCSYIPC